METYNQLTDADRIVVDKLRQVNCSIRYIASVLQRSPSTISREIKRNSSELGYDFKRAQKNAMAKRQKHRRIKMTPDVIGHIEAEIRNDLSPEQISNTMEKSVGIAVSHEWIYQHIFADKANGGTLFSHCRIAGKKRRRKRYGSNSRRGKIKNRKDIELRPKIVDDKTRIGDWEADTIIGRNHKGAIVTLVERKTKFLIAAIIRRKTATETTKAMIRMLKKYSAIVKTITFDNGLEFSGHEIVSNAFNCDCYFARPYHSWERGLNENTNGLIRQYFPKKTDFRTISDADIDKMMERINNRPRKTLGYMTPKEMMRKEMSLNGLVFKYFNRAVALGS